MSKGIDFRMTCKDCGKKFNGGTNAVYCPTCKMRRKIEQNYRSNERQRKGLARKIGNKYRCNTCNRLYILTSSKNKNCSTCRTEVRKMYLRKYAKEHSC